MSMTTMHANQLDAAAPLSDHPLEWRESERPEPAEGQVLIKVVACGVCRSNLHMIEGDWAHQGLPGKSPLIPGHEVTGHVEAVGPGVQDFSVGDPVGVQPLWWTCEMCEFCQSGREQLCHERLITGELVDGGYGEYMVATAAHTYLVPEELDLIDAAPLFCPGITAYGAVDKVDDIEGKTVAIFGLGGVGHMAVQFAAIKGANVIAVGRTAEHRRVAIELGASSEVDSTDENALAAIADTADAIITFAPSDEVSEQAFKVLKWGGTFVNAIPLNVKDFHFSLGQTIKGSLLGNREQMREVLRLAAEGKIRTVTERFPMEEAQEALEALKSGKLSSRAVLYVK